jgi:hypothetical protein
MKDNEELLEKTPFGYAYYLNNNHPLNIRCEVTEGNITVTVEKYYKGHVTKSLTKRSAIINTMSQQQIEDYIMDVIDAF